MSLLNYFNKDDPSKPPPAKKRKITETVSVDISECEDKEKEENSNSDAKSIEDHHDKNEEPKKPQSFTTEEKRQIAERNRQKAIQIRKKRKKKRNYKVYCLIL